MQVFLARISCRLWRWKCGIESMVEAFMSPHSNGSAEEGGRHASMQCHMAVPAGWTTVPVMMSAEVKVQVEGERS